MFILRTTTRNGGDMVSLNQYNCIIRACSTAQLLSDRNVHGNVTVTNTETRKSLSFVNGKEIR